MIRQLLEEVKAAPLDEASPHPARGDLRVLDQRAQAGLAPELVEELERLSPAVHLRRRRRRPSCGSPRPSSSAGSRGSSTASRPRSTPSRWRPGPSSSRCAAPSHRACGRRWSRATSRARRPQSAPGRAPTGAPQRRDVPLAEQPSCASPRPRSTTPSSTWRPALFATHGYAHSVGPADRRRGRLLQARAPAPVRLQGGPPPGGARRGDRHGAGDHRPRHRAPPTSPTRSPRCSSSSPARRWPGPAWCS